MSSFFKLDLLNGQHAFSAACPARTLNVPDTYKAAIYLASATVDATTASYSATGEVGNSGTYAAGGPTITWTAPAKTTGTSANGSSTTYTTPTASIQVTSFTAVAFDAE